MNANELLQQLTSGHAELIFQDWLKRTHSADIFVRQVFGFGA